MHPNKTIHDYLLNEYGIGFTDVAKRASAMGHELKAADFKRDAPKLYEKLQRYQPSLVWFHGKVAINKFMYYGFHKRQEWQWGFNNIREIKAKVFISPNPSPANAAFSLERMVEDYKQLRIC